MSIIEIILSSDTAYVLLLYLISAKVQSKKFKEMISHIPTKKKCNPCTAYLSLYMSTVFQLDFEIFRTIASFIQISLGHSLITRLIFL